MSLFVFWLRKGPTIKYVPIQNAYSCVQWVRVSRLMCTYAFALFLCFWQHLCLIVFRFICRNLTIPLFKKDMFVRNSYFSPTRSISVVSYFCEPKLAKMLLILIKQNLRYTLYFSVIPNFEKTLRSVAQEIRYTLFFF